MSSVDVVVSLMTGVDNWIIPGGLARSLSLMVDRNGRMQHLSFLGPFFQFTSYYNENPAVGNFYFPNATQITVSQVESATSTIRLHITNIQVPVPSLSVTPLLQTTVHRVVMNILKSSEESKRRMLEWLSVVVQSNLPRSKIHFDPMTTGSDAFLLNVSSLLLRLAAPFTTKSVKAVRRSRWH